MKLDVLNISGQPTGRSVDLPDHIFGIEPNDHVLYLAVKQYQANQRQGTHKAKERAEVARSTRKIKKQKGSGTARAGSLKSPLFKGGGTVFGPRPRDYSFKLNKKVKQLARASALSEKAKSGEIRIIEDFTFDAPKTQELHKVFSALNEGNTKNVLVTGDYDKNVYLSGRNLAKSGVVTAGELSTYDIMNCSRLILTEGSIEKIASSFKATAKK